MLFVMKLMNWLLGTVWLGVFAACSPDPVHVPGNWKAVAFFEDRQRVQMPLDSVALLLTPEGSYVFRSIGYYRESGPYRLAGAYLYLTDTTDTPQREHTVKILDVSPDTLKLLMQSGDKRQVLFFSREK
jgi:hypothetical protein